MWYHSWGQVSTINAIGAIDTINAIGAIDTINAIGAIDTISAIDTINAIGAIDTISTIDTINAIGAIDTISTIDTINAIGTIGAINTIGAIDTIGAINTIGPIDAVGTINTIDTINAICPGGTGRTGRTLSVKRELDVFAGEALIPEAPFLDSVDGALFGNIASVNHASLDGDRGTFRTLAFLRFPRFLRLKRARCREGDAGQGTRKPYPYQGPRTPHHHAILSESFSVVLTDLFHWFSTPKRIAWDHAL